MSPIQDHPLRYALANELHARPFPTLDAPCRAAYLAIKPAENAAGRDRAADVAHLRALLDHYAAPHPEEGATHYFGQIGQHLLKWESHTEFVTYTVFGQGAAKTPFDAQTFAMFPEDWLASAPGLRVTSALIRVEEAAGDEGLSDKVAEWFVPESVAVSRVLDDEAVIAGDFRIDPAGHMRFALFVTQGTGRRRTGRIIQRLCEIETYKAMSMLGFARVKQMTPRIGELDAQLTQLMGQMTDNSAHPDDLLPDLLATSIELETLSARSSFRFGATGAYEAIVNQRIEVLREQRFDGRQSFADFMMRRYDPAIRTVKSTERRLQALSDRAIRAGELLRTRVDVERSAQNQDVLESGAPFLKRLYDRRDLHEVRPCADYAQYSHCPPLPMGQPRQLSRVS